MKPRPRDLEVETGEASRSAPATTGGEQPTEQSQSGGFGAFFSSTVGMLFGTRAPGEGEQETAPKINDGSSASSMGSSFHDAEDEDLRTASVPSSPSKSSGAGAVITDVDAPLTAPAAAGATMRDLDLSLTVPASSSPEGGIAGAAPGAPGVVSIGDDLQRNSPMRRKAGGGAASPQGLRGNQHSSLRPGEAGRGLFSPTGRSGPAPASSSSSSNAPPTTQQQRKSLQISTSFSTSESAMTSRSTPFSHGGLVTAPAAASSSPSRVRGGKHTGSTDPPASSADWTNAAIAVRIMEDLYPKAALEKDEHSLSTFKTELNNIDLLDVYEKTPGAKADSFTSFRENLIRAMIHSRFGSPLGKTRMSNSVDEGDPLDQTTRTVRDVFDETGEWQWPVYRPRSGGSPLLGISSIAENRPEGAASSGVAATGASIQPQELLPLEPFPSEQFQAVAMQLYGDPFITPNAQGTGTNHQSEQGGLFGPWDSSSSAVLGQLPNANQARGPAPAWPIQDPYGGKYVSYDGGNQQTISGYEPAVGSSINPPIPANLSQDYVGYASKELSGLNSRYNAAPTAAASGYSSQVGSSPASRTVLSLDKLLPELRKAYAPANEIEIHPDMEADPESLLVFVGKKRKRKRKRRSRKSRGGDAGDEAAEAGDDLSDVAEEEDEEDSPVKEIGLAKDIVPKVVGAGSGPRSGTGVDAGRRVREHQIDSLPAGASSSATTSSTTLNKATTSSASSLEKAARGPASAAPTTSPLGHGGSSSAQEQLQGRASSSAAASSGSSYKGKGGATEQQHGSAKGGSVSAALAYAQPPGQRMSGGTPPGHGGGAHLQKGMGGKERAWENTSYAGAYAAREHENPSWQNSGWRSSSSSAGAGPKGKTYGLQSQYSNSAGSYNDHYTNTYPPTSHAHQMKGDSYGRHPSLQQSSGSAYDPSYSGGKMSKGGKQGETSEAGGKAKGSWRPSGWQ
eukprot:CAMPEP_0178984128 /NCGR_PEP_ID=MMETSP0795-20121207/1433_1 /TAXON_ID=88552 /ORGANISM="Amoebophrya sp., Strain Ameob2" /LENGTH=961 /DNA_ID=CAMNT_0020674957 /DNA_START=23 /DNA_END=2908 /DNA_ORIENTATION=-